MADEEEAHPQEDIFNIREIFLHETAEDVAFKYGVFARHLLANTLGVFCVTLSARSTAVFARALRFAAVAPSAEAAAVWAVPLVCVATCALATDPRVAQLLSDLVSLVALATIANLSRSWTFSCLSDRELDKISRSDATQFKRLVRSVDASTSWHHRPPDEVMLCEVELCALYAGIDLADTWLLMREQEESVEEDDYFSELPETILKRYLEVLAAVPWAVALYPSFEEHARMGAQRRKSIFTTSR